MINIYIKEFIFYWFGNSSFIERLGLMKFFLWGVRVEKKKISECLMSSRGFFESMKGVLGMLGGEERVFRRLG